jgi:hypothetical protein
MSSVEKQTHRVAFAQTYDGDVLDRERWGMSVQ